MLCEVRGWIFRRQERRKPGGLCPDPVGQPFSLLYINEKTGYAFWPAVCRRACAYAFDIEITFKRFGRAPQAALRAGSAAGKSCGFPTYTGKEFFS